MTRTTSSDPTTIEMKAMGRPHPAASEVVIAPRTLVALVMVSLGGLLLLAVGYMARAILLELSAAIVLAMALEPALQAFQRRGMVRGAAVTVTYVIAAVVVSAFLLIMLPPLVDGVAGFVRQGPELVRQLAREYPQIGFLKQPFNGVEAMRNRMMEQGGAPRIGESAFDFVRKVLHSQASVVSILFLSFFVAMDGRGWCDGILGLMPDALRERWRRIGSGVAEVVGGYVFGNVLISVIAGTVATLVLLVMRVPYALPLGLLVAFLDLIPLVGALIATVIVGAVALITQGVATSAIVVAALLLYQQFENNTLSQLVYNRTVKISALAVAVSVLVGAEIAGIPGALLAIPVAGSLKVITHELRKGRVALLLLAAAASWCGTSPAVAQAVEVDPRAFARGVLQLEDDQLAAIDRGDVVTRLLETTDAAEIAAFGVVRTAGTPDLLLRLSKDVKRSRQVPQIAELGLFSSPPGSADLDPLLVPPEDVKALRKCSPGSCDVKLGPKALDELAGIDWAGRDADSKAVAVLKRMMLELLVAYQQGGTDSLDTIVDKSTPKSRTEEYQGLLAHSPYLVEYVKEFHWYLAVYPEGTLSQTGDLFYWTKEDFGLKPVISIYHQTLHREGDHILVANKLLAASHYVNASLEILAGVPAADGKGLYLLILRRSRIDPPTGKLAGIQRGKVKSGLAAGVRQGLEFMRDRLAEAAAEPKDHLIH